MGLIQSYKRLRHALGFGVHSPSAYRYVREVVRLPQGMAYYAYRTLPETPATIDCRLLYRVALDLRPATYAVACGNASQRRAIAAVIRAASPEAMPAGRDVDSADMVVACAGADTRIDYRVAVAVPASHPLVSRRCSRGGSGHVYRSASAAIIREDVRVPFQIFEISF